MKLYRSKEHPGHWIGEETAGGPLVIWPAEPRGWSKRKTWTAGKRGLDEVDPADGRGTGWPGGPVGRKPRARGEAKNFGIRATVEEIDAWSARAEAEKKPPSVWARDTLNAEVARPRKK